MAVQVTRLLFSVETRIVKGCSFSARSQVLWGHIGLFLTSENNELRRQSGHVS